jgi:hypothetical protein
MRIRHLIAVLLVLGLGTVGAMAADYTVPLSGGINPTGYTDYASKPAGEVLVYGGLTTGTTRMQSGYFKFDTSALPAVTVTGVVFHFYVNATNWPYWSTTPLTGDPTTTAAATLWTDIQAEKSVGYYNYQNESSSYAAGWHSLVLGGTANADVTAAIGTYFALGAASRDDGASSYYLEIDGFSDANVPYLVVSDNPPPANDTCAGAIAIPGTPGSSSYTGDTSLAANDYDCSAACVSGLAHGDKDVAYSITLPANCEVCVTLNQSVMTWNGGVYMVTDCADVNGTCVAGASGWLTGGLDETFCYSDTATQTYYIIVDGRTGGGSGAFQLDVTVSCLSGPTNLTCTDVAPDVDLAWTNNDTYDNVEVYQDGVLIQTLSGSATSTTVTGVVKGYHCYYVCGVAGTDSKCSEDCCLIQGYDTITVEDFEGGDGGYVADGTGGWQWGAPTYGPCFDTADGNVWGTDLDAAYINSACWLLDSAPIDLGDKGAFVCFDHCYDIETTWDGGVVWFTTDDFWYYNFEPLDGTDVPAITATPGCQWVAGRPGFSGNSGGWVTDCWDFTDPMWLNEDIKIRFAFGSDTSVTYSGWLIDNVTVYNNVVDGPFDCDYTVLPASGTVPFQVIHRLTLTNTLSGGAVYTRRIAARIKVTLGNGTSYNPWRSGFTNVQPSTSFLKQFPLSFPAVSAVIGNNTFTLTAMDVTPTPYNQPPYPPSGTTCQKVNVVVANAP